MNKVPYYIIVGLIIALLFLGIYRVVVGGGESTIDFNSSDVGFQIIDEATGQAFAGNGMYLHSVKFKLSKGFSPVGYVNAKIYAISGTYGSTAVPTGSALAVSGNINVSDIPASPSSADSTFYFVGSNIKLQTGQNYFVVLENNYDGGGYISMAGNTITSTHPGNSAVKSSSVWTGSDKDLYFYVYGDAIGNQTGSQIMMSSDF